MPTPESPASMMMEYKDVLLLVYPLVGLDESSENPTPAGSYACFIMRAKWDRLFQPPGGGTPVMASRPRDPEWTTIRVVIGDTSSFTSIKDAFEAGKEFADLLVDGRV